MTRNDSPPRGEEAHPFAPATPAPRRFSPASDAFLLDVDGTILDIAFSPNAVIVPDSLKRVLGRLQELANSALALVSGREIAVLDRLFAPLALAAVGCHGAEWRTEARGHVLARFAPIAVEIKRGLIGLVGDQPSIRIEDKRYTLAFHYRRAPNLKSKLEQRLLAYIAPFSSELRLLHGKCVIEVTPRGFDKGEAVTALMRTRLFEHRRPVFLGDDKTDEDAFAAVRDLGGVGISVGRRMQVAELMLPNPQAARLWLARVAGE